MPGIGYYGIEMRKGETDRDLLLLFGKYCSDDALTYGISEIARFRIKRFAMFWWDGSTGEALKTLQMISNESNREVIIGKKNVFGNDNHVHLFQKGKRIESLDPNHIVTIYTAL